MTLGDFVRDYREKHIMSQRDFAKATGLSAGYISMLENNANPRTGEPITPSITTIKQIADAVGVTVDALLSYMDSDAAVSLDDASAIALSPDESEIISIWRSLNSSGQAWMLQTARMARENPQFAKESAQVTAI